jgi:hypothetical protein
MIDDATPYRVSEHGPGYDGEVFARFFSRKRAEDECCDWVKAHPGCQAKLDGPDADLPLLRNERGWVREPERSGPLGPTWWDRDRSGPER